MLQGTVKWFSDSKGYGFIAPDGGNKDVFVHVSAVEQANLPTLKGRHGVDYKLARVGTNDVTVEHFGYNDQPHKTRVRRDDGRRRQGGATRTSGIAGR